MSDAKHENHKDKENVNSDNLTDEQNTVNSIGIPDHVAIQTEAVRGTSRYVLQMNQAFELSQYLYKEVLSPELKSNEDLKRTQKENLMHKLFKLLKWQFVATYISLNMIILIIAFSSYLKISESIVGEMITLMKFYISSIVGELIAVLFFIVKNVFDKSIVELIRNFDKRPEKQKDTY